MLKYLLSIWLLYCCHIAAYSQLTNKATNTISVKAPANVNTKSINAPLAAPPCLVQSSLKDTAFTVCEGSAWTLEITDSTGLTYTDPGYTWLWSGPNGFTSATNPTDAFVMNPLSEGAYSVTVTSEGCPLVTGVIFNVTVKLRKITSLLPEVCEGALYILPDGTTANTSVPGNFNELYYFTSAGEPSCTNDSIVGVSLLIKPKYDIAVTASLCQGRIYTLPNGTTADKPGTYPITLTAVNGCDSLITTILTDGTGINTVSDIVCIGKPYLLPDGMITTTPGTYPVTLVGAAATGCDSVINTILTDGRGVKIINDKVCTGKPYLLPDGTTTTIPGTYPVTLLGAAASGCDSVVITILKEIIINTTTVNTSICKGDTLTLPDGKQVTDAGVYPVTLTSLAGCDSTVNYNVKLAAQGALLLPNSFTPNNDARNDCFGLNQLVLTSNIRFDIYSRWGQLVFSSSSPDACWDGTLKGIPLPIGAYVWFLKSKTACGDRQQQGTVLLLR
jgi:gliding motility-associated-like protein